MNNPFTLTWSQNGSVIRGYQGGAYVPGGLVFPISFPSTTTNPQTITLNSSALANGTLDILSNIKFYLTGDPSDLAIVQGVWPNVSHLGSQVQAQLGGGLQISFDGIDWTTFSIAQPTLSGSVGIGDANDASTWLEMPALAVGPAGELGTLGPFDIATLYLRYVVPSANIVFPLTVANVTGNNAIYTGVILGGAENRLVGQSFTIQGFTNASNNGTFEAVASTYDSITLENPKGIFEINPGAATLVPIYKLFSINLAVDCDIV
jgi:hypothetical protein